MVFTGARWSYLTFTPSPVLRSVPSLFCLFSCWSPPPFFLPSHPITPSTLPLLSLSHTSSLCTAVDLNLNWWKTKLAALTTATNSLYLALSPTLSLFLSLSHPLLGQYGSKSDTRAAASIWLVTMMINWMFVDCVYMRWMDGGGWESYFN